MVSRGESEGGSRGTRRAGRLGWLAVLAVAGLFPVVGCQVEYAGMTLPSGKYMHDDVQYFAPGPDFPWANSQAATQRARMRAMGYEVPESEIAPVAPRAGAGALLPQQNVPNMPTNVNSAPIAPRQPAPPPVDVPGEPIPAPPAPGLGPAPFGEPAPPQP